MSQHDELLARIDRLERENIALRAFVRLFQGLVTDMEAPARRMVTWRDEVARICAGGISAEKAPDEPQPVLHPGA